MKTFWPSFVLGSLGHLDYALGLTFEEGKWYHHHIFPMICSCEFERDLDVYDSTSFHEDSDLAARVTSICWRFPVVIQLLIV